MRRFLCTLLCLLLLLGTFPLLFSCDAPPTVDPAQSGPSAPNGPEEGATGPNIIFDTDMDRDCDDVGALALLCEYHNAGKANLLGVVTDAPSKGGAACCEAICSYYGIRVPIGTIYNHEFPTEETDRFDLYREGQKDLIKNGWAYNLKMSQRVGKVDADYPSSARVYRELLAAAEDKSVTVVVVGLLTALDQLFLTEGDELSPLSGVELFEKKVIRVVSMGRAYYPVSYSVSFNYKMDPVGAENVFKKCPVPIYVSDAGGDIIVGASYTASMPADHPVRMCYEVLQGKNKGRSSWDLIAVLYAMDFDSPLFSVVSHGTVSFDAATNLAAWHENSSRKDYLVSLRISNDEMEDLLEKQSKGIFEK